MNYTSYNKPSPHPLNNSSFNNPDNNFNNNINNINNNPNNISDITNTYHLNSSKDSVVSGDNIAPNVVKRPETPNDPISDIQNKLHKLIVKNKPENKLNKLNIIHQFSDPDTSKSKNEVTPQTPIGQPQNEGSDKSLSLTIINNIEDIDSLNDLETSNNVNGKISPRASSSIGEEMKAVVESALNSTNSKTSKHFSNWRPSLPSHSTHPSTWSVEQVCQWLREKGLHSVINQFVGKYFSNNNNNVMISHNRILTPFSRITLFNLKLKSQPLFFRIV